MVFEWLCGVALIVVELGNARECRAMWVTGTVLLLVTRVTGRAVYVSTSVLLA